MTEARDCDVVECFPVLAQSAYGTKNSDEQLVKSYPFFGPDLPQLKPILEDDSKEFGRGFSWASRQDLLGWDAKLKRNWHLTSALAGWLWAFALGQCATTHVGTLAYSHVFNLTSLDDDNGQLPVHSRICGKLDLKKLVRDLVLDSLELTMKPKSRLAFAADFIGSGYSEASTLAIPALAVGNFLSWGGVKLELGPTGALVDVSALLKEASVKLANGHLKDTPPGGGLYLNGTCYAPDRKPEIGFTLLRDSTTLRDAFEAQDELALLITVTGDLIELVGEVSYCNKMIISMPACQLKGLDEGFAEGLETEKAALLPIFDTDLETSFEVTVVNEETNYLDSPA